MTKRSFLTLISAILLVFVSISCGNDKQESDKTDTGDTETITDTGDTETTPDTDPTDTDDTEVVPDEGNTGTGNVTQDGCTIKSSFGTRYVKRDIADTCIQEIAKADGSSCSWDRQNETPYHIAYLLRLVATFARECKDKSREKTVECPDFIPETLKLESLTGCDVYSIDPDTDCLAPCADIYFSTNDDVFHTVYIGGFDEELITSSDKIKEASFISDLKVGSNNAVFTWSEKAEDGSKVEKKVSVEMTVADSSDVEEEPVPTEDADVEMNDGDEE